MSALKQNYQELQKLVQERSTSDEFMKLVEERERLYVQSKVRDEKLDAVKKNTKSSFVEIREATIAAREIHELLAVVNNDLNKYRSVTANLAHLASKLRADFEKTNGSFVSYDEQTIGNLIASGSYESGSAEWHDERRSGIGGSDVAKIMRVDEKYAAADYRSALLGKLGLAEPDDEDFRDDLESAVGRGNAWEDFIRYMYADRHPNKNVAFCKASWRGRGDDSYKHANFDGLILDDSGKPVEILEIKTGIHSDKWQDTSLGIFGVPENYRKQIFWYAMNAGLSGGTLVAVLDDYDYREYTFTTSDPRVQEEFLQIEEETSSFWRELEGHKSDLLNGVNNFVSRRKGFSKTLNMKNAAKNLAAYTGNDFESTYVDVREAFKNIVKEGSSYSQEQIQETLTKLYASHDPSNRTSPLIGIDIETNHAAVKKGRIIETGIVQLNPDGTVETLFSGVHGVSETTLGGLGSGDTSIHRITADMLNGAKSFDDTEIQKEILEHLKKGVLVAHNASFEDRFLTVNLAGYAEARDAGEIQLLDTKEIATRLMLDSENNSLMSFAEDNGVPYVGAHAAITDTLMMMKALRRFQETLHKKGRFVERHSSIRNRVRATKDVAETEESR